MDVETRERLFKPFFMTETGGEQQGTGLGLSVVHGIDQTTGGQITLQTKPGVGTPSNVCLPRTETAPSAPDADSPTAGRARSLRGRVLVVDEEAITALESIGLPRLGLEVTAHTDPRAAPEAVDANDPYDLVLPDCRMPDLSGLEMVRKLQQRGHDGPVVWMSGFQAQIPDAELRRAGVDAVLQKPVNRERSRRTIAQRVRRASR
jgi:CheY-like chemotaxis protein